MKTRTPLMAAGVVSLLLASAIDTGPASAITNGELDGDMHPHVVLVIADAPTTDNPNGGWRCSGTMMSANVVLTAGHCVSAFPSVDPVTGEPVEVTGMRVFPASDVQAGIDAGTSHYPDPGPEAVEAVDWAAHPEYEDAAFFVNDVGIVVLGGDGVTGLSTYGEMPELDELDSLKPRRTTSFTAVGYGLQQVNGAFFTGERVRMVSHPYLLQVNTPGFTGDFSLLLSNNHATGGTCFGDSGGPNFLGDGNVVAGVTSFGLNGSCGGTGGVFRVDRADVQHFVNPYLGD